MKINLKTWEKSRNMHALLSLVLIAIGACGGCGPLPPPKPVPSGDAFVDACENMKRLGDEAGLEADCAEQLQAVEETDLISMEPHCLASAESRAQLDACYADDVE